MQQSYYIASCVFTSKYPELSRVIQQYIHNRYGMQIVRCCVPKYDLQRFKEQMPEDYRDKWDSIPDCADFQSGDTIYSLCHNCSAILEESKPGSISNPFGNLSFLMRTLYIRIITVKQSLYRTAGERKTEPKNKIQ